MRMRPGCVYRQLSTWPHKEPQNPRQAVAPLTQVRLVTRCPNSLPALRHCHVASQGISAQAFTEEQGDLESRGSPHLRKECGEPRSSHIHQKHFFFTFLLFRRKSCFSGTGASAGDLGGEGASSAGSASSRLWRISWNLPSCCRKSYSTLKDREEGRRVTAKWHTLI